MTEFRWPDGEAADGPGGPIAAARRWIGAVMHDWDWDAAWLLTDPLLRLAQAQAWLWGSRTELGLADHELDELAEALCQDEPTHPLWEELSEVELHIHHQTWSEFDLDRWQVAGRPRVVAPDLEVVLFLRPEEDPIVVTDPPLVVARPFLMRFGEAGWLVAHAGSDQLPVPGWPPEFPSPSTPV